VDKQDGRSSVFIKSFIDNGVGPSCSAIFIAIGDGICSPSQSDRWKIDSSGGGGFYFRIGADELSLIDRSDPNSKKDPANGRSVSTYLIDIIRKILPAF
jgi:hypothetical protein